MFIFAPILVFFTCSLICYAKRCVLSSFAIIMIAKLELATFLMSCDCYCTMALIGVPWDGLHCVNVVFPDHTYLLCCFLR